MQKGIGTIHILVILALLVLAGSFGYVYVLAPRKIPEEDITKPFKKFQESEQQAARIESETVSWESLIPEIREIVKKLPDIDIIVEERNPMSIFRKADITGDGYEEALVNLGTGGAYVDYLVLMKISSGRPVALRIKKENGFVSYALFNTGASARHSLSIVMVPDRKVIYSASHSTDDFGKLDKCNVEAYQWSVATELFEFNKGLSKEFEQGYCQETREKLEQI